MRARPPPGAPSRGLLYIFLGVFLSFSAMLLYKQFEELSTHERAPLEGLVTPITPGLRRTTTSLTRGGDAGDGGATTTPSASRKTTDQICYARSDESEVCEYDNVICWDGEGPVVVVPEPMRLEGGRLYDGQTKCMDFGALEPSAQEFSRCNLAYTQQRPYAIPQDYTGAPALDHSVPMSRRRWGPLGRGDALLFREVSPWEVYGGRGVAPLESFRVSNLLGDDGGGSSFFPSPGLRTKIVAAPGPGGEEAEEVAMEARHRDILGVLEGLGVGCSAFLPSPPLQTTQVDWLDEPLWFIDTPSFENHNPFHWMEKLGPLWDAQRANGTHSLFDTWGDEDEVGSGGGGGAGGSGGGSRTKAASLLNAFGSHPRDTHLVWSPTFPSFHAPHLYGSVPPGNCTAMAASGTPLCHPLSPRSSQRLGGYGRLPSQSFLLFASHPQQYEPKDKFLDMEWAQNVVALAAQGGHRVISPTQARAYSSTHLLCSRRGAMAGIKPRIFSGRADAYTFRNAAYVRAGVVVDAGGLAGEMRGRKGGRESANDWPALASFIRGSQVIPSHLKFPPRAITVLVRGAPRVILNLQALVDHAGVMLGEGSTPVAIINLDKGMGGTPWAEQVRIMSRTGILVATHGAGEANTMFLPSGAAVIELFPWKFHKSTYRILASNMGHWYRDIVAKSPPDPLDTSPTRHASDLAYSLRFYERCIATNLSSGEFHSEAICNMGAKWQGITVPMEEFKIALVDALEHISAFSLNNHEWRKIFEGKGLAPIPYAEWSKERPAELIEEFKKDSEQYG